MAASLLRLPDDLHDKIRWLAYKEKRPQTKIIIEILQKALSGVKIPKEAKR
jgi:predicted DNA-binding protein